MLSKIKNVFQRRQPQEPIAVQETPPDITAALAQLISLSQYTANNITDIHNLTAELRQSLAEHAAKTDKNFALLSQNSAISIGGLQRSSDLTSSPLLSPLNEMSEEDIHQSIKRDYPSIYPLWLERLNAMKEAFIETGRQGNAAHGNDFASNYFRQFIAANYRGRIIDVGCGVHGKPYYLSEIDGAHVAGVDPLEPLEKGDFSFATGIGEYLPWVDESFETVVSGTSLDHCVDIEKTLSEFKRVVRSGGNILIWMSYVPGAKEYRPDDPEWTPEDKFHLYHPDESWFEPILSSQFEIRQKVVFYAQSFNHCFYELTIKDPPA